MRWGREEFESENVCMRGEQGGILRREGMEIVGRDTRIRILTNIRLPHFLSQIFGPAVAHCDRRVLVKKEEGQGSSNDVRSSDDNGLLAGDFDTRTLEHLDATLGSAGDGVGLSAFEGDGAEIVGAEAVDIFVDANAGKDFLLVHVFWEGELDEDTCSDNVNYVSSARREMAEA